MERVPPQMKNIARTALLRYAIEQGRTVMTSKVMDEALAIFMPARMAEKMQILAEDLAVAKLRAESQAVTAICSHCGYTVKGPNPVVRCPVCGAGADKFQLVSREAVEAIAAQEGGIAEEESLPGVVTKWSADARDALREVTDAYLRRRAKARVEKYARSRRIAVITCELALPLIEDTVGRDKLGAGWETLLARTKFTPAAETRTQEATAAGAFRWTPEAVARLNRVAAGFMRDMTREEVEKVAREKAVLTVDLAVCEEGIGHARNTMNEVIAGYIKTGRTPSDPGGDGRGRVSVDAGGGGPSQPGGGGLHARHDPGGGREGRPREGRPDGRPGGVRGGDRPRPEHDERGHRGLYQDRADPVGPGGAESGVADYTAYSVSWNLTQRCNLVCAHCYMSAFAGADTRGELSTEECRRVIDEIGAINPNVLLILTGGEPFLRKDLFDVAAYAADARFTVVFGTNGLLLREGEARRMREAGVLGASLSLDSTDRERHDRFRHRPGAWDGALRATRVLRAEGLDFSLHMSVTDWNLGEIPAMIDLARA